MTPQKKRPRRSNDEDAQHPTNGAPLLMTQPTAPTTRPAGQAMDPSFIDDYHATQNLDRAIRHGRRADHMPPPWALQMQAEADRAATALTARDITRGVVEDVVGPHPQMHRKATA